MIQKTSELLLSLRDSANRSEKEQARIKQELNIQQLIQRQVLVILFHLHIQLMIYLKFSLR